MERSASCSFKPICTRHGKGCERLECANKTPGGLTDAGGRRAGTGVQEHAPGNTCDTMRGHRVRGSVCTIEKAAAGGQQLRSRSRSPDGWCTWRGSPKHLRKQPRCASGAQHRGSRGLCGCIARAGKTTDGPAVGTCLVDRDRVGALGRRGRHQPGPVRASNSGRKRLRTPPGALTTADTADGKTLADSPE